MISLDGSIHTISPEMISVPAQYEGMTVDAQILSLVMEVVPDDMRRGRVMTVVYIPSSSEERETLLKEFGFGAKVTLTLTSTAAGLTPTERMDAAHAANVELAAAAVAEPVVSAEAAP